MSKYGSCETIIIVKPWSTRFTKQYPLIWLTIKTKALEMFLTVSNFKIF